LILGLEVLELLSVALANPADDHRTVAVAPEGALVDPREFVAVTTPLRVEPTSAKVTV
jgi:phosphoglucomutase